MLNLLDAFGNFAQVREIAERSFAHREAALEIAQLEERQTESKRHIQLKLTAAGCNLTISTVVGFERLVSARARLHESQPQTRAEVLHRWLDEVVQPGRVVGIGRSGRRLVLITEKREGNVRGIREDGRSASFALERIGRVYAPVYRQRDEFIDEAFADVRERGRELVIPEPRLRDAQVEESEAVNVLDDQIEANPTCGARRRGKVAVYTGNVGRAPDAEDLERATRRIARLREEVWEPFHQRARARHFRLSRF